MNMPFVHDAVNRDRADESDVMVVLCSEDYAAAALLASCDPAVVLQTLGGARDPADTSTRSTFDYGFALKQVRRVIVCGHVGCKARPVEEGGDARAHVLAQCRGLLRDPHIGALLRDHRALLQGVWFDGRDGHMHACDIERGASTLMGADDVERFIAALREPLR